ncbi:uncharacterized protein VDAG_10105 [Verticillium dahliae VdLs.17]|uniref:Uncharacterized protein n=1 Tax=Verticillium dahliae (strain VdLs.17 / ATCC MYA-4575 / FGSC 10137) TaxID=498257 RepID=G2XIQ7_VERDV|nr:uncharacterized protein VDAG_10105 [Verticillium dahliae VdLs.17]EGY20476.1 hypothetical protein VDAG_10105 [Verticillium dahliae VdLs.17]
MPCRNRNMPTRPPLRSQGNILATAPAVLLAVPPTLTRTGRRYLTLLSVDGYRIASRNATIARSSRGAWKILKGVLGRTATQAPRRQHNLKAPPPSAPNLLQRKHTRMRRKGSSARDNLRRR